MNPDAIRSDALIFNAAFPEAADAIATGTVEVHVSAQALGSGWKVRLVAEVGVRAADGGWIGAGWEPAVATWTRRATEPADTMARRFARRIFGSDLPVTVTDHH